MFDSDRIETQDNRAKLQKKRKRVTFAPDGLLEKVKLFEDYIRRQEFKEVEPLIRDYVKVNPNSWWGHYVLGYTLFGQRRIGDSIAALARSLQLNLENADAHRLLGRNLMTIGRFDAAQTELEQALKLRPQWAEAHYDLGKIYSAHDNYPPARREPVAAPALPQPRQCRPRHGHRTRGDCRSALARGRRN